LFSENFVKAFFSHFKTFVKWALENPNEKISEFSLLSEEENHQLLMELNNTKRDYPKNKTIHQLFEEQVEKTPHNIAVTFEDQQLTYQELNQKANQLACFLREKGVKPDALVAIVCDRSLEMVISILAVLKAGGAYVPLDPTYPIERLAYMIEDTKAPILLTRSSLLGRLPKIEVEIVLLDNTALFETYSPFNLVCTTQPNHLAYVIYTSGSTGQPKGVMIEHKSICDRLFWWQEYSPISSEDRYLHQVSFSFDAAVVSLWWPLLNGSSVIITTSQGLSDVNYLVGLIKLHKITVLLCTPAMMNVILDQQAVQEVDHIQQITLGGETFSKDTLKKAKKLKNCRIYNSYGPAETTIVATSYDATCRDPVSSTVPIGTPVANTQVYILDSFLRPVPVGMVGELYIGGKGLARGYLNQPELTAERFIDNPFASEDDKKEGINPRLYKTGDLCHWLEDGTIEYMGRVDDQVKLRGFRIELGEIESILKRHPAVKDAIVILREDIPGDKRLAAYLISKKGPINFKKFRSFLKPKLPMYMIPSAFFELDSFPLTTNGKIDKKELPKPLRPAPRNYVGPQTEREQALARIIKEFLNVEQVSIHDNFFDLGIHSLMLFQLHSKIQKEFSKKFPMIELLTQTTIKKLLNYLTASPQSSATIRGKERSEKRKQFNKA
jgi:amino acid adenylation domain-containing protein